MFNIAKSTFTLCKLCAKNVLCEKWSKNSVRSEPHCRVSGAVFNLYMQLFWFLLLVKWKLFQSQQQRQQLQQRNNNKTTMKSQRSNKEREREKKLRLFTFQVYQYTRIFPIQWQINMEKSLCNAQQSEWIEFQFRKKSCLNQRMTSGAGTWRKRMRIRNKNRGKALDSEVQSKLFCGCIHGYIQGELPF